MDGQEAIQRDDESNIDFLLRDIIGDDGLADYPDEVKFTLAVLFFIWQQKYMKKEGLASDINEWLAQLEAPVMSVEAAINRLKEVGILNNSNGFKASMKEFSGILVILFAHALKGTMEVSLKDGQYAFKMTPAGEREVEEMMKRDKE